MGKIILAICLGLAGTAYADGADDSALEKHCRPFINKINDEKYVFHEEDYNSMGKCMANFASVGDTFLYAMLYTTKNEKTLEKDVKNKNKLYCLPNNKDAFSTLSIEDYVSEIKKGNEAKVKMLSMLLTLNYLNEQKQLEAA